MTMRGETRAQRKNMGGTESAAYTNELPWGGLGVHREGGWKNVDALIKDAKLDWQTERRPIYTADGTEIEGFASLTRDRDNKIFDIVGSRYVPTQNKEAFAFFKEFVEAGKATMDTAGALRGGRIVWGLAKLNTSFELKGKDMVNGYLLCICPHEQGKSLMFKTLAFRPWCSNTIALGLRGAISGWRMGHRTNFNEVKISDAKKVLGLARDTMGEFENDAKKIQKLKVTPEDVIKILLPFFGSDVKGAENARMKQLIDIYENAPGAQPGNGWGVLNAVTYYADHVASRTPDKRLTNAWLGRTANQKDAVLAKLLEMA
jgi:phage/plasmid-like protein (TIGR03299 family)